MEAKVFPTLPPAPKDISAVKTTCYLIEFQTEFELLLYVECVVVKRLSTSGVHGK